MFDYLDGRLRESKFLASDELSVADYQIYEEFNSAIAMGNMDISRHEHIGRWMKDISDRTEVQKTNGELAQAVTDLLKWVEERNKNK